MVRGRFIVVYAMNNLGKSTVIEGVKDYLEAKGIPVGCLKYPIYDLEPTGPRINRYLRGGNPENLDPFEAQLVYAQNLRDYQPTLLSRLQAGEWIVAEDYTGTGEAWGCVWGHELDKDLGKLREMNKGLRRPDLAILLDGKRFTPGIEQSHLHEGLPRDLWNKGRIIHLYLASYYKWEILKANQSEHEVLADAVKIIERRLFFSPLEKEAYLGSKEREAYLIARQEL